MTAREQVTYTVNVYDRPGPTAVAVDVSKREAEETARSYREEGFQEVVISQTVRV